MTATNAPEAAKAMQFFPELAMADIANSRHRNDPAWREFGPVARQVVRDRPNPGQNILDASVGRHLLVAGFEPARGESGIRADRPKSRCSEQNRSPVEPLPCREFRSGSSDRSGQLLSPRTCTSRRGIATTSSAC